MQTTIYSRCENILREVCYSIPRDDKHILELELIQFLISPATEYEKRVGKDNLLLTEQDIINYKRIMMLIIVSTSYKMYIKDLMDGLNEQYVLDHIRTMESLRSSTIFKTFENFSENKKGDRTPLETLLLCCINDFFNYTEENYIYENDCMQAVLEQKKDNQLLKINFYELLGFLNYINPSDILPSERTIQDYLDISLQATESLLEELEIEDIEDLDSESMQEKMNELVCIFLDNDEEKIRDFYGYIFGNVYEYIKNNDYEGMDSPMNTDLIEYFENPKVTVEEVIIRYNDDLEFFEDIYQLFLDNNRAIGSDWLPLQREKLKEADGIETLMKFNPYYEVEEVGFQKKKNYNNNNYM